MFCPLFKGVAPDEIGALIAQVDYQKRKYGKGEMIAQRGDDYQSLMIVLTGAVNAEMIDKTGKIIKIEELRSGMLLAAAVLFSNKPKLPVNITTLVETDILYLPKDSLAFLLQKSNPMLLNFLQMVSNRATFLTERIWFLSFKTIREKIAHYLIDLADPETNRLKMTLTQQQIADYFGVTRPALARSLAQLEEEQVIRIEHKELVILDRKKLMQSLSM
jgi:CRP-like cAMP-binding protein